jgi:hypothetical protein
MQTLLSRFFGFIPPETLVTLAVVSLIVFLGTLIVIPIILVRLPADYFDEQVPRVWMKDRHPAIRLLSLFAKNLAGVVFLLAGVAMLVLPGQGLLTLLIGISLLDFPGKRRLERRIIGQPTVLKFINSLREKFGRPPLTTSSIRRT